MTIFNTLIKKNKEYDDINLTYEEIPKKLVAQFLSILNSFMKIYSESEWEIFYKEVIEELGLIEDLSDSYERTRNKSNKLIEVITNVDNVSDFLSIVDVLVQSIEKYGRGEYGSRTFAQISNQYTLDRVIDEWNTRFRENAFGYKIGPQGVVKIGNELLHAEITTPVLHLLSHPVLKNAEDEFLKALEHFKIKNNQECINECLKSLESTLKIICHENGWVYNQNDTSKVLIQICFNNNLIPAYLNNHFSALRATIESGIPTVRNRTSGHGQGVTQILVPDYLASYVVYMTGTTIKFLVDCQNQIKPF